MKNLFTAKKLTFLSFLFMSVAVQSQELDLETPVRNITDQIKAIFPYIAGVVFLIAGLINLGHFTKENGKWERGVINIVIFVAVFGIIAGLFSYITNSKL